MGHANSFFPVWDTMCLMRCSLRLKDLLQPASSHLNGRRPTCDLRCCIRCSFRLNDLEHTSQEVKLTVEETLALVPWVLVPDSESGWVSCLSRDRAEMAFICWVAAMDALVTLDIDSDELLSWSWEEESLRVVVEGGGAGGG